MSGLMFGEQPRWHEDRLWFADWGTQEVIAVDLDGNPLTLLCLSSCWPGSVVELPVEVAG